MNKTKVILSGILLLALLLRIGMNAYFSFNAQPDFNACGSDCVEFEKIAWSVASGEGYILNGHPTSVRAPGLPFLIAALYKIFGRNYTVFHISQAIIGTITCFLLYLLTKKITKDELTGLFSAFICAGMPLQVYYTGHYGSETLAVIVNVLSTYFIVESMSDTGNVSFLKIFIAGLINGLATLVRPIALLYMASVGFCAVFWSRLKFLKVVLLGMVFLLGMLATIVPWTYRNYKVFNKFSLVATNGGSTFWGSNNQIVARPGEQWGGWISTNFAEKLKEKEVYSLPNEVDRDKKEWTFGMQYLREHVSDIPSLIVGKYLRLLSPLPDSPNRLFVLLVAIGYFGIVPFILTGIWVLIKQRDFLRRFYPVLAQIIVLFACTGIFYGEARFRATYEPFFIIFAAAGMKYLFGRIYLEKQKGRA